MIYSTLEIDLSLSDEIIPIDIELSESEIDIDVEIFGEVVHKSGFDEYDGEYVITPDSHENIVLETSNKLLNDDITVLKIPTFETSNESGTTLYIGKEIEIYGN